MSTISKAVATEGGVATGALEGWSGAFGRAWSAFKDWRTRHSAIAQLHAMSDRELRDIGISRWQIRRAVMGERDRIFRRYY